MSAARYIGNWAYWITHPRDYLLVRRVAKRFE